MRFATVLNEESSPAYMVPWWIQDLADKGSPGQAEVCMTS